MPASAPRRARLPQLEIATPLIAIAAAREVVDAASRFLGEPLPATYAAGLAARARVTFARSPSFRRGFKHRADAGRERLYIYLRHWLATRLHRARPDLFARLPDGYATGTELPPNRPIHPGTPVYGYAPVNAQTATLLSADSCLSPDARLLA